MLWPAGAPPESKWQSEGKFDEPVVDEALASLDADGHGCAVYFGQDIRREVVVKIPQAKFLAVFARVDIAIRTSRVSVPSEQTPQFVARPKRQSLIEHLAHRARLEAVPDFRGWHGDSMAQTVVDPRRPALRCEQAVDPIDWQGSQRGHRRDAQPFGNSGELAPPGDHPGITVVAAEQFIPAVGGQDDFHRFGRDLGD